MNQLALLLLLAVAGCGLLVLADVLIRRPVVGAALVLGVTGLSTALGEPPAASVGPFSVYPQDALLVALTTAVAARFLRGVVVLPAHVGLCALVGLVALSVLRGLGAHDVSPVLNEARDTLYFLAVALYFATIDPSTRTRELIGRAWLGLAGFLVVLAVVRWAAVLGGLPYTGPWRDPAGYGGLRVLWSDETLLLGQAFLILLPRWLDGTITAWGRRLAVAAFFTVGLLQHRSVWVCLFIGGVVVVAQQATFRQRAGFRLLAALLVAGGLCALLLPGDTRQQERLFDLEQVDTGTFEWRMDSWLSLIRQNGPQGPADVAVGLPYGSGWSRRVDGYVTEVSPHNYYVELGLRVGLVGLLLLLAVHARTLNVLSASPRPSAGLLSDRTLMTLLVTQLVYYLPYWPNLEQGVLLGLAVGACYRLASPPPVLPRVVRATSAYTSR